MYYNDIPSEKKSLLPDYRRPYGDATAREPEIPPFTTGRQYLNVYAVFWLVIVPLVLFGLLFAGVSFSTSGGMRGGPTISGVPVALLLFILAFVIFTFIIGSKMLGAYRDYTVGKAPFEAFLFWMLLFAFCLLGLLMAVGAGSMNYWSYMQEAEQLESMNHYHDVSVHSKFSASDAIGGASMGGVAGGGVAGAGGNSSAAGAGSAVGPAGFAYGSLGSVLLDAGRIMFGNDTKVDVTKSIAFRNKHTYCVAPIVSINGAAMASYDLWAVGMDCCSVETGSFTCPEYSKTENMGGIRVLNGDQRAFYRLAVQQAEATYMIKAMHPLFFVWTSDPYGETQKNKSIGMQNFFIGFGIWAVFIVFAVACFVLYLLRRNSEA